MKQYIGELIALIFLTLLLILSTVCFILLFLQESILFIKILCIMGSLTTILGTACSIYLIINQIKDIKGRK